MTEPTEADYAATRSLLDGWPFDDNEHSYYADIGTCTLYYAIACKIATARAEERAEFARLAQSEEMVEKIIDKSMIGPNAVRTVLTALFRETAVST